MNAELGLVADRVPFSWVDGPGNRYVLFLQGCNFNCTACHNPHTIPLVTSRAHVMTVEDVLGDLRRSHQYLSGITASGGEATLQRDFLHDVFAAIKGDPVLAHLTTFIDSNGSASTAAWDHLLPVTDGVMLDLKALDPELHSAMVGSPNDAVLSSIRHLAAHRKLYEVRLMLVPGVNDDVDQLRRTADWLLSVDASMRIKVIAFRNHGVRAAARRWPQATDEHRAMWRRVLETSGVRTLELV